jgi:cholesterol 7-desaturase
MLQVVEFRWYADPRIPSLLVSYIVGNWIAQYENDVFVWENKAFMRTPQLVKEDGPVRRLRSWYRQFNSPRSPQIRQSDELDW